LAGFLRQWQKHRKNPEILASHQGYVGANRSAALTDARFEPFAKAVFRLFFPLLRLDENGFPL